MQILPPATERGDLFSSLKRMCFAEETSDLLAIFSFDFSDAERCGNGGDKFSKRGAIQSVDLDVDLGSAICDSLQARFRRNGSR